MSVEEILVRLLKDFWVVVWMGLGSIGGAFAGVKFLTMMGFGR